MTGRLIAFEGGEGSGKSTQAAILAERLGALRTFEPGDTPLGASVRELLLDRATLEITPRAEALLMAADRAQHVAEVIRPALAAGMVVVCDRYGDSTLAYQGFGSGTDLASLEAVTQFATGGLSPHLTVLIDLDVRIGLERKRQASRAGGDDMNRIDLREVSYHERVREGFLTLARRAPERFFVVDGTKAPELIADEIWDRVVRLVPVKAETRRLL